MTAAREDTTGRFWHGTLALRAERKRGKRLVTPPLPSPRAAGRFPPFLPRPAVRTHSLHWLELLPPTLKSVAGSFVPPGTCAMGGVRLQDAATTTTLFGRVRPAESSKRLLRTARSVVSNNLSLAGREGRRKFYRGRAIRLRRFLLLASAGSAAGPCRDFAGPLGPGKSQAGSRR